ncbi:MAG: CoA transferase [Chloroflexi bacterium]|nr:CoA transferase [Chloroflexota bacterium]
MSNTGPGPNPDGDAPPLLVVELSAGPAAAYCGWMFAASGHEVVLVEPPSGSALRTVPPFAEGAAPGDGGASFLTLASGKRSVVIDLSAPAGREDFAALCDRADVVLTDVASSLADAGLTFDALHERRPGLILTSITPFGERGPYAGFAATSAVLHALGGYTYITGEAGREPLTGPESFPEYIAGANAFAGTMAALLARQEGGPGQEVEVNAMECLVAGHQFTLPRYSYQGLTLGRTGNRYASLVGVTFFPCADGVIAISASSPAQLSQLFLLTGHENLVGDGRFDAMNTTAENSLAFDEIISPWFAARPRDEAVELCQAYRVPAAPVLEVDELLQHPQLAARNFWGTVRHPAAGDLKLPRAPFVAKGTGRPGPAPLLGEHQSDLAALRSRPGRAGGSGGRQRARAIEGVRVLDLTRVWSGPVATRILADLGADVIKVEHPGSRGPLGPDGGAAQAWNRNGLFNELNRNKRSLALDLSVLEARQAFLELARGADLVFENFSPRVMGNLGIGFDTLNAANPALVMVSMPGYGLTGPMRDRVAYGTTIDAEAGTASVIGYAGGGPERLGVAFPDYVAGVHAAGAAMAALLRRHVTQTGEHVDISQFESIVAFMAPAVTAWQLTGERPARMGNAHPLVAPQGVYRCAGQERWVAISAPTDESWRALAGVIGRPGLAADPRLATAAGRQHHQRELDEAISRWTRELAPHEAMLALQSRGIPAGEVLDGPGLFADHHLDEVGFFVDLEHPLAGRHRYPGLPIHLSATPPTYWADAPCLGEHNSEVLQELLGYDIARLERLASLGAIAARPPA